MQKMFVVTELVTEEDGKVRISSHQNTGHTSEAEAIEKARKQATKYVGDVYGVFALTGTVVHPIPELDLTPAS